MLRIFVATLIAGVLSLFDGGAARAAVLFQNNFDTPTNYIPGSQLNGDISSQTVNALHGTSFQNSFTVETLRISGGSTFSDPSGIGGAYALGMLSTAQNDLMSATFDAQSFNFLNLSIDVSAIDLDCCGGPFNPTGTLVPEFQFRLYDAPGGAFNLFAPGAILDTANIVGTASPRTVFDWTSHVVALDASGSTDGNVALVIDLLQGGYASLDNLVIASDDTPGGGLPGAVPEPGILAVFGLGLAGLGLARRRKKT